MKLVIGYLYPDLMNIYGDTGNIITLKKRCEWRGIDVEIKEISVGNKLKKGEVDIFFFGGGQDQQQNLVAADLVKSDKGKVIKQEVERGVPLLSICGGYQLLGEYYQPFDGPKLIGTDLFPVYTKASNDRMIGNIVIRMQSAELRVKTLASQGLANLDEQVLKNSKLNTLDSELLLVGFENHSGKTYLKEGGQPLGKVVKGFGNNGEDQTEGCIYRNAIGCYMHGSLLPKNPTLADWLIEKALEAKEGKDIYLEPIDDTLEELAHKKVIQKVTT